LGSGVIHKSQGGTFDQVVYEYHKGHPQELVYVALFHVTSIAGLYITFENDETKFKFYYYRVQAKSIEKILNEFQRLSLNTLQNRAKTIIDFIRNKKGVSIITFNVQSLKSHSLDLTDAVSQKANVLLLSEINMIYEE